MDNIKRFLLRPAVIGVIMAGSLQCNSQNNATRAPMAKVVNVPYRLWPGCKDAPEMDELFRLLRPGEEITVKLKFLNSDNSLQGPNTARITAGSVYFFSRGGYFRLDSNRKLFSSADGRDETELDVSYFGLDISYDSISNTSAASAPDLKYKIQPIQWEEVEGRKVGTIRIKLSDDFKGDLSGWNSCHGT